MAMSLRVAPRALRTPISRVRSVTLTSMMFMTPTPPTSRAMAAMRIMAAAMPPVMARKVSNWPSLVKMAKSFGSLAFRPRRVRRIAMP